MDKDYYKILDVSHDATENEIKKAYRKLALKYHPDKTGATADSERFTDLSEAYEVLSDPQKRQAYNQTMGGSNSRADHTFPGGAGSAGAFGYTPPPFDHAYAYHGNARATFAQCFDVPFQQFYVDPFNQFFSGGNVFFEDSSTFPPHTCTGQSIGAPCHICNTFRMHPFGQPDQHHQFQHQQQQSTMPQRSPTPTMPSPPPMEHDLYLSLEEVNSGCLRHEILNRKVVLPNGMTSTEEKKFRVDVKPGWTAGTRITFEREGDRIPGQAPADVVFIIRDKPHATFKRECCGCNIRYVAKVSLRQALCGGVFHIPVLSGSTILLDTFGEVITPTSTRRISGEGLPLAKNPTERGSLIVAFDISFPVEISEAAKDILADLIPDEKSK